MGSALPAKFHAASCDRKLSPVELLDVGLPRPRPTPRAPFCCSTYVSIAATCVPACPFKRAGCYVDAGFTRFAGELLDRAARGKSGFEVALDESELIDRAFLLGVPQDGARGGRDLRLHVGGDAPTDACAKLLAGAARRWKSRGGGSVWTYTHSWRHVSRSSWGSVSVLASVEQPHQIAEARARGYAPALVVARHTSSRAYELQGTRIIPCPAETTGRTCVECRLCLDRDLFAAGAGIAFAMHGQQTAAGLVALTRLPRAGAAPPTLRAAPPGGEEEPRCA